MLVYPSSPKLIPTPGFLPPGYSLFSCVFLCFLPPGEILKSGVGITFGIPNILFYTIMYYYILVYTITLNHSRQTIRFERVDGALPCGNSWGRGGDSLPAPVNAEAHLGRAPKHTWRGRASVPPGAQGGATSHLSFFFQLADASEMKRDESPALSCPGCVQSQSDEHVVVRCWMHVRCYLLPPGTRRCPSAADRGRGSAAARLGAAGAYHCYY